MTIDTKQIFIDTFTNLFESVLWLVPIAFIVAIYLFFFRYEVAYYLELSKREHNKLTEKLLLAITMITAATITYLYIKEYFFLLSLAVSFILTYFLYLVGIIDMIANKLEARYGRY